MYSVTVSNNSWIFEFQVLIFRVSEVCVVCCVPDQTPSVCVVCTVMFVNVACNTRVLLKHLMDLQCTVRAFTASSYTDRFVAVIVSIWSRAAHNPLYKSSLSFSAHFQELFVLVSR